MYVLRNRAYGRIAAECNSWGVVFHRGLFSTDSIQVDRYHLDIALVVASL